MTAPADIPATPVEALWPGRRTPRQTMALNALLWRGIDDLRWLVRWRPCELLELRGFGVACLEEVRTVLAARGLSLAGDEADPS